MNFSLPYSQCINLSSRVWFIFRLFFHYMVDKACNKLQEIFKKNLLSLKKSFIRAYSIVPFLKTKNLQNGHRSVFALTTKMRLTQCFSQSRIPASNKTKDYEISSSYTDGFILQSHIRRNLFTYSNFSQILGQFPALLVTGISDQPVEMSTLKNSLGNKKESPICFFCMRYRCQ